MSLAARKSTKKTEKLTIIIKVIITSERYKFDRRVKNRKVISTLIIAIASSKKLR